MATLGSTTITTLSVFGNTTIGGTTTFTGGTTHKAGIQTTTLNASGNTTIGGTTTFTGKTTHNGGIGTNTLAASGNATIGGTLGVTGVTTLNSTLNVTGATTLNDQLSIVGNIVQKGGNIILDSDKKTDGSYGATPRLVFRRGSTTDTYSDWDMWGNSDGSFLLRKGTSSTGDANTWKNIMVAKEGEVEFSDKISCPLFDGNLTWSGSKHLKGSISPLDAALAFGQANRFSFLPDDKISIEYSTDAGSTWIEYPALSGSTDEEKAESIKKAKIESVTYTSNSTWLRIGNLPENYDSKNPPTAKHMLRYTFTTENPYLYAVLAKFIICISTDGSSGAYCTVEVRTRDNYSANNNIWNILANRVPIDGWSGWNTINTGIFTTYGYSPNSSFQYSQIRFTFGITSHTTTSPGLKVSRIFAFGPQCHGASNNSLASTGNIYTYNYKKNVTFPAEVTATRFNGDLNGKAGNAEKLGDNLPSFYFRILGRPAEDLNSYGDGSNANGIFYLDDSKKHANSPFNNGTILSLNNSAGSWMLGVGADHILKFRSRWWSTNGNSWTEWKEIPKKGDKLSVIYEEGVLTITI